MERYEGREPGCVLGADTNFELPQCVGSELLTQTARLMARQQLAVSSDSPFRLSEDIDSDQIEKAYSLREETDEIRRQLALVRSRLNEFNQAKQIDPSSVEQTAEPKEAVVQDEIRGEERKHFEFNQQATSSDSQFHPGNRASEPNPSSDQLGTGQTRTRPLTGKTDCPNCECDKRRQSICDNCANLQQSVHSNTKTRTRRPSFMLGEKEQIDEAQHKDEAKTRNFVGHDERPLRPASVVSNNLIEERRISGGPVEVHREVVPNQVFSIGKSLNEKRVELARAIDDLQIMIDRVKKRGERLDQERKVAQLYKEQWRFGPKIGGGSSVSSVQYHGPSKTNYKSRLDPQLTRDSNSLMGFQHVDPLTKSRQFGSGSSLNLRHPSKTPEPRPRYSKMRKMASIAHQMATSNRLANSKRAPSHHGRSKSLDSLRQVDKLVVTGTPANPATKPRVINHAEAERQISAETEPPLQASPESETKGPEEELEEELDIRPASPKNHDVAAGQTGIWGDDGNRPSERQSSAASSHSDQAPRKMSWVPVFGETEIKSVDRRRPSRKILVLGGQSTSSSQRPAGSILRKQTSGDLSRASAMKHRSYSAVSPSSRNTLGNTLMNEATKKLKFATNLLEREKRDSCCRNQLIIMNRPRPTTTRKFHSGSEAQTVASSSIRSTEARALSGATTTQDKNQEIERLQAKVEDQRKIISQFSAQTGSCCCGQHRQSRMVAPLSRQTRPKSVAGASVSAAHAGKLDSSSRGAKQQLAAKLKEQLNRTKSRLAKMLEEERAKHQKLEKKVHSSLRRQTDLRAENEILRQSLHKCIDTCLLDISSTFESLSQTIFDSAFSCCLEGYSEANINHSENAEPLDLSQLLDNNRHLRQLRSHVESIEDQRRNLFEELSNEKLRCKQLELQLIESKLERDQLVESNKRLECKLLESKALSHNDLNPSQRDAEPNSPKQQLEIGGCTNSVSEVPDISQQQSQADLSDKTINGSDEQSTPTTSTTFDSIDIYRQYIQSMTPDLEAIRRERRMILNEFDNIKKMLANMNE